jgi:hypothetical protein
MYAQRFFESPTVCAYLLTMLVVGLLLDAIMLRIQDAFPAWSPGTVMDLGPNGWVIRAFSSASAEL